MIIDQAAYCLRHVFFSLLGNLFNDDEDEEDNDDGENNDDGDNNEDAQYPEVPNLNYISFLLFNAWDLY